MSTKKPEYFLSLEGIRGYAFLAVFFLHYNLTVDRPASLWRSPIYLAVQLGWFLVPIFFVLSGFLITRILLATRQREGFFRIFYIRRALRVLPLYYIVVAIVFTVGLIYHFDFHLKHLTYLIYLQNFTQLPFSNWVEVNHFWSLAIEEQFYLLWPLAVWKLRSEKALLRFSYFLVAACAVFRIVSPLLHLSLKHAYAVTPYRVDGIILGCALAIHYQNTQHWDRFVRFAKISIPVLFACLLAITIVQGSTLPTMSYLGNVFCTPAMNVIGLGFVILALTPGSIVARVCSGRRICSFGQLTYGLYLVHEIYAPLFMHGLAPKLAHSMPAPLAQFVASLMALALTTALAWIAHRYVEQPMLKVKEKYKYGAVVERPARTSLFAWPRFAFSRAE